MESIKIDLLNKSISALHNEMNCDKWERLNSVLILMRYGLKFHNLSGNCICDVPGDPLFLAMNINDLWNGLYLKHDRYI